MSNNYLMPALRFPEFKNEGEWIINKFQSLLSESQISLITHGTEF